MPAVSKAQQKFMGMVHAAQKGETPASKEVEKAADNMSHKSAKDFASTKHKGLPNHVKEGSVTTRPEVPTEDDLAGLPSSAISQAVTNEGPLGTMRDTKPTPTNDILWKATGRVCEGRGMTERVKMYEKKGGGWRMGKHVDETVYTTLGEFYKNEIKPRKEAKELMVKRRMGENILKEDEPGGDVVATNGVQDHEVSMAKASLVSIGKAVNDLMGRLGDTEKDIPGWIQDHITNAENYIVQASKGYYDQEDKKLGNNIPKPENQTQYSNGK
jgi:hypothetical protein